MLLEVYYFGPGVKVGYSRSLGIISLTYPSQQDSNCFRETKTGNILL